MVFDEKGRTPCEDTAFPRSKVFRLELAADQLAENALADLPDEDRRTHDRSGDRESFDRVHVGGRIWHRGLRHHWQLSCSSDQGCRNEGFEGLHTFFCVSVTSRPRFPSPLRSVAADSLGKPQQR